MAALNQLKLFKKYNIAFIALTTKCNCRCLSCEMWKNSSVMNPDNMMSYGFDRLMRSDFGVIEFTGGEPLLLDSTIELIEEAKKRGFFVQLMSNGTISDDKRMDQLAKSAVDLVCVSVDCHDSRRASAHRGVKDINSRIRETVREMRGRGILLSSTTLITKSNYHDIEKTVEFINSDLGIYFSFCPPDFSEHYKIGKNKKSIAIGNEEMIETLQKILELKRNGYKILNTKAYIRDAIRWFSGRGVRYKCMAGKRMIYVDWNMKVYPCFVKNSICGLSDLTKGKLAEQDCNQCCFQCFREPSIFYNPIGKIELAGDAMNLLDAMTKSNFLRR